MSSIETFKKLQEHNADQRLVEFFNNKLYGLLNFGKHQEFVDSAAKCDAKSKARLRACGNKIQLLAQTGREKATATARNNYYYKHAARNSRLSVKKNG